MPESDAAARSATNPLLQADTHFAFGKNWADYSRLIDDRRIAEAEESVRNLVGESLTGETFLDIGCGSGLFSLAAQRVGAARILSIDIDKDSVSTTKAVRERFAPSPSWEVRELSVFDATVQAIGQFDVVYSWGVLHHTGDMWGAIKAASAFVKPGGLFVISIYLKTPFCGLWKVEKRLYTNAPEFVRSLIFHTYKFVADSYAKRQTQTGVLPDSIGRGMEQDHDYKDWLGGYPYESASVQEIDNFLVPLGFDKVKVERDAPRSGIMGTGCTEYVYRRRVSS